MADIKKGSLVQLKSGGPKMTVLATNINSTSNIANAVKCTWFTEGDNREVKAQLFDAATLNLLQE